MKRLFGGGECGVDFVLVLFMLLIFEEESLQDRYWGPFKSRNRQRGRTEMETKKEREKRGK